MKNIKFKVNPPTMDKRKLLLALLAGIAIFLLAMLNAMVILGKTDVLDSMVQSIVPGNDTVKVRMGVYTGKNQQIAAEDSQENLPDRDSEDNAFSEIAAQEETEALETPARMTKIVSRYEFVKSDASWTEANQAAMEAGGHLAVITSEEEFDKICEIADTSGVTYIWLGAQIFSVEDNWEDHWITGEEWTFDRWYPNEPSKIDTSDNAEEFCLCLWNVKYEEYGWTFNDQRDNLAGEFSFVSGKLGYIIEYEEEVEEEQFY